MPGFERPFHSEEVISTPDGNCYRVRVGVTGVPRFRWSYFGPERFIVAWLGQQRNSGKTWTVEVTPGRWRRFSGPGRVEVFSQRAAAADKANLIAEAIAAGRPPPVVDR